MLLRLQTLFPYTETLLTATASIEGRNASMHAGSRRPAWSPLSVFLANGTIVLFGLPAFQKVGTASRRAPQPSG
eukprot:8063985-Alexandrium_andersonii.AAC.1